MSEIYDENELLGSVSVSIKERVANHLYGTFFLAWCASNWEAIFIAVFTSEEQLLQTKGILKIDYIWSLYSFSSIPGILVSLSKLAFAPAISVYLVLWIFSGVDLLVFKKAISNKVKKIDEQKRQMAHLLKVQTEVLKSETKVLVQEEKKIKAEKKKTLSQSESWDKEYLKISTSLDFESAMTRLRLCIYQYNGSKKDSYRDAIFSLAQLSFLHLNDLIEDPTTEKISMTDKGRYFLKKFVQVKS